MDVNWCLSDFVNRFFGAIFFTQSSRFQVAFEQNKRQIFNRVNKIIKCIFLFKKIIWDDPFRIQILVICQTCSRWGHFRCIEYERVKNKLECIERKPADIQKFEYLIEKSPNLKIFWPRSIIDAYSAAILAILSINFHLYRLKLWSLKVTKRLTWKYHILVKIENFWVSCLGTMNWYEQKNIAAE